MALEAFLWGIVSAVSLPLGAALGLLWRPGARITAGFMAFGAGALLFALTVELMAHVPEIVATRGLHMLAVAAGGAVAGGLIFDVLNQFLNNRGAFIRNFSNAKDHVVRTKRTRARRWLRRLARMSALKNLPPEDLAELVSRVCKERYHSGETVFSAGDAAREVHFIRRGHVELVNETPDGTREVLARLGPNETFGELGMVEGGPRSATACAVGELELYTLDRDDLDELSESAPAVRHAIEGLARTRREVANGLDERQGAAENRLDTLKMPVSEAEIREESGRAGKTAGVALAIWLGIGIDAFPESVVIGTLAIGPEGMSLAFITGVFLANLPEAMSSAVSMRCNAMRIRTIMLMWGSLCLLTGAGAGAGALLFPPEPEGTLFMVKLGIEGLAAGAMLTMIAETMLPEAFEQGGSIIGLATLCGFLAALVVAAL